MSDEDNGIVESIEWRGYDLSRKVVEAGGFRTHRPFALQLGLFRFEAIEDGEKWKAKVALTLGMTHFSLAEISASAEAESFGGALSTASSELATILRDTADGAALIGLDLPGL